MRTVSPSSVSPARSHKFPHTSTAHSGTGWSAEPRARARRAGSPALATPSPRPQAPVARPPPAALVPGPLAVLLVDPRAAGAIWASPSSLLAWGSRKRPGSGGEQQRVPGTSLHAQGDQGDRGSEAELSEGARVR